jgi:hypothetical protein
MSRVYGYDLVARVMRKPWWILDFKALTILFNFVGISLSGKTNGFSGGVIANVDALLHFLLNWRIWNRASPGLQVQLYDSLARLVTTDPYATFNVDQIRSAEVKPALFFTLREASLPPAVAKSIIVVLRAIMNDPISIEADLKPLFHYTISTFEAGKRRVKSANPRTARQLFASSPPSPDLTEVRSLVFSALLEVIATNDAVADNFFTRTESFPEILFSLLEEESPSVRVLLLKFWEIYLSSPTRLAKFLSMSGFQTLGQQLRIYEPTDPIFAALFSIMLEPKPGKGLAGGSGSGVYAVWALQASMQQSFLGQLDDSLQLRHPGALVPIFALLKATESEELARQALKLLHDTFLQNEKIKQEFLETPLITTLVDLLNADAPEFIEDILRFLRQISLYGCKSRGVDLLNLILMHIQLSPLGDRAKAGIQRRLMRQILEFFTENDVSSSEVLSDTLEKLCQLVANTLGYQATLEPGEPALPYTASERSLVVQLVAAVTNYRHRFAERAEAQPSLYYRCTAIRTALTQQLNRALLFFFRSKDPDTLLLLCEILANDSELLAELLASAPDAYTRVAFHLARTIKAGIGDIRLPEGDQRDSRVVAAVIDLLWRLAKLVPAKLAFCLVDTRLNLVGTRDEITARLQFTDEALAELARAEEKEPANQADPEPTSPPPTERSGAGAERHQDRPDGPRHSAAAGAGPPDQALH